MKIDPNVKQELKKAYQAILTGGGTVEVITAYNLSDADKKQLANQFEMLKDAHVVYSVEPEILAGVIIKFGSKMIDLSLRNELTSLEHIIYERL